MQKVSVPQPDGEIVITPGGGGEPKPYEVTVGMVDVADEDVALFLSCVDGSVVFTSTAQAAD